MDSGENKAPTLGSEGIESYLEREQYVTDLRQVSRVVLTFRQRLALWILRVVVVVISVMVIYTFVASLH